MDLTQQQLKEIHIENAKAISAIEDKIKELYYNEQKKSGKTKANNIYKFDFFKKKLLTIKSKCDDLIQYTNPEIDDNINYYYNKYTKKKLYR